MFLQATQQSKAILEAGPFLCGQARFAHVRSLQAYTRGLQDVIVSERELTEPSRSRVESEGL